MKMLITLGTVFWLVSCVVDRVQEIAIVQNKSKKTVLVAFFNSRPVSDKDLFNPNWEQLAPDSTTVLVSWPTDTCYVYICTEDSIDYCRKNNLVDGIIKKSLLKKYMVTNENRSDTLIFK